MGKQKRKESNSQSTRRQFNGEEVFPVMVQLPSGRNVYGGQTKDGMVIKENGIVVGWNTFQKLV